MKKVLTIIIVLSSLYLVAWLGHIQNKRLSEYSKLYCTEIYGLDENCM